MNDRFYKVCIFLIFIVGCGDNSIILDSYYHSDFGTKHSTINKRNENSLDEIIIDSRVDQFIVEGNKIYVARRPTIHFKKDGTMRIKLTDKCEFYVINIKNGEVDEISDKHHQIDSLGCLMED